MATDRRRDTTAEQTQSIDAAVDAFARSHPARHATWTVLVQAHQAIDNIAQAWGCTLARSDGSDPVPLRAKAILDAVALAVADHPELLEDIDTAVAKLVHRHGSRIRSAPRTLREAGYEVEARLRRLPPGTTRGEVAALLAGILAPFAVFLALRGNREGIGRAILEAMPYGHGNATLGEPASEDEHFSENCRAAFRAALIAIGVNPVEANNAAVRGVGQRVTDAETDDERE